MSEFTNDTDDDDRIDMTLAAIRGHDEARRRLEAVGFGEDAVRTIEDRTDGFVEFARLTAEAVRWERELGKNSVHETEFS